MGRCKKGRGGLETNKYLSQSRIFLILLTILVVGCQRSPTLEPTITIATLTDTPRPTHTLEASPTLGPTETIPPEVTPTPSMTLILAQPHAEIAYISPITVQHKTKESIHCYFELNQKAQGYLFYWPLGANIQDGKRVALATDSNRHLIKIEGLTPGEAYQVAVGVYDGDGSYYPPQFLGAVWDPIQIETLATELWPVRIAVFGDSGFGDQITYQLAEQMASNDLDFVLHTGDVVYNVSKNSDVQEAYAIKYYQALSPILRRFPIYPVPGNHEYYQDAFYEDQPYYFHVFPPIPGTYKSELGNGEVRRWYAIELGPIQFLLLDTQLFWRGTGRSEQTAWLSEQLSDDRFEISIPVFHVPPFTSGRHGLDGVFVQRDWIPLFEQASVPLVFSGHDHNYERLSVNGIKYIVTGGGSSVLYPLSSTLQHSEYFAYITHFVLLEIYPEYLELSAITTKGEILDQVTVDFFGE